MRHAGSVGPPLPATEFRFAVRGRIAPPEQLKFCFLEAPHQCQAGL
jgi:hypothetical protein